MSPPPIRLVAVIDAARFTGPARTLAEFSRRAARQDSAADGRSLLATSIVTFVRESKPRTGTRFQQPSDPSGGAEELRNEFVAGARAMGIEVDLVRERHRYDLSAIQQLHRVIERRSPDIIQTHSVKSHFLARLSGPHGCPWVAFHHGYTATDLKDRVYNQLNRWSLRFADRVITVSQAFARQLEAAGVRSERIRVIHNAIEPDRYRSVGTANVRSLRGKLNLAPDERLLLSIGRLSFEKGHVDLVVAFYRLMQRHPELRAQLVILGDGPERDRIRRTAASLGIAAQVVLAGHIQDPGPYLAAADLLAIPSYTEGSPNVLLEAMIARLPIVATAVGGIPEMVTDYESALLIRPRDPDAMAEALYTLVTRPQLAADLAERARETALRRHSPEARLRHLMSVYLEIVPECALAD